MRNASRRRSAGRNLDQSIFTKCRVGALPNLLFFYNGKDPDFPMNSANFGQNTDAMCGLCREYRSTSLLTRCLTFYLLCFRNYEPSKSVQ